VTLKVDGRVVFQWPADYAGVRLYPEWKIPDPSKLFIGSYATRFLIRRLVLVDRTQG
jgi:hypothetical protein